MVGERLARACEGAARQHEEERTCHRESRSHDLRNGTIRKVATNSGLNAGAALSPDGRRVAVRSTLPPVVDPEIEADWQLAFFIPTALLEAYVGPIGPLAGQEWRANLYKCGDRTSHPHWASWSPVDALNFHLPHCFGTLRFEP